MPRKLLLCFLTAILLSCESGNITKFDFETYVTQNISEPQIPDNKLNVQSFRSETDSLNDWKTTFDVAIAELKKLGGGTLVVPPGNYFIKGPLHLTSHLEIKLEKGARLYFSSEPKYYLPVVKTSWEGTFLYNYSPFIYAFQCTDVAITGEGIIDGEASDTWSKWKTLQKKDQLLSREMNHQNIPVNERIFGEGHYLRPQLIQFYNCKNVKVEGITIEDSPFWCIHLLKCEGAIVRAVRYNAFNYNNDGIDPEYAKNVLIEEVYFNNSDDNVAIKAGRDNEGRASATGSENIIVRNCHFKGLHAIVIGSEMSAGVKNVLVKDCDFAGKLKRGIYLKSNPDRGGFIHNIYVDNVRLGEVEDCIYITSFYHNEGKGHVTDISNVYMNNITCQKATQNGVVIQGYPDQKVKDIYISNLTIDTVANALSMVDAENIVFSDVILGEAATAPSYVK
ncbi:glycoside hydrolase family 28 protein [Saccharicrinis sp. FJH54]|uniref:glycoside hydrolase family 28 protein n=1 Tax=Saccharicrinis sp. FJH54 TaxID=3344665 RepID=UPI0035D442B6